MGSIINCTEPNLHHRSINPPFDDPRLGTGTTHTGQHQAFDEALNDVEQRLNEANLGDEEQARGDFNTEQGDKESDGKIEADKSDRAESDRQDTDGQQLNTHDDNSASAGSDEEMKDADRDNGATVEGQKPPSPIVLGRRAWRFDVLSPPILRE